MIRVRFERSFDRDIERLDREGRAKAQAAVDRLLDYFDGGPRPLGLGLRKLREPYWEVRAGLGLRIFFSLEAGLAKFILAGSHDQIRRRLR